MSRATWNMTGGSPDRVPPVLVLGLGNSLLSDDGVGLILLERLRASADWPDRIDWVDGGTQGIALLGYLSGRRAAVILDAVQLGAAPGTVHVLGMDRLRRFQGQSSTTAHEANALQLLATAEFTGDLPESVTVVGIEPETIRTGIGLTSDVTQAIPEALERARQVLAAVLSLTG